MIKRDGVTAIVSNILTDGMHNLMGDELSLGTSLAGIPPREWGWSGWVVMGGALATYKTLTPPWPDNFILLSSKFMLSVHF